MLLPVGGALDTLILNHLDPVPIRIQQECHVVHPTVSQALLEINVQRLEAIASGLKIIDRDAYCRESALRQSAP